MDLSLMLQVIQTVAVVLGVLFGLFQLRQLRHDREAQAGIELLDPLQASDTAATIFAIAELPDGLDEAELRRRLGPRFDNALTLLGFFECLGPMVARGHLPIDMYAEIYRGATIIAWRKFETYVRQRRKAGWSVLYEWVQWLAERMEDYQPFTSQAAFERYRDWKSPADFKRLSRRK